MAMVMCQSTKVLAYDRWNALPDGRDGLAISLIIMQDTCILANDTDGGTSVRHTNQLLLGYSGLSLESTIEDHDRDL